MAELPQITLSAYTDKIYIGAVAKLEIYPLNTMETEATAATVTWTCGSQGGTAVSMTASTYNEFVIPISLYNEIPNAQSITLVLQCHAYNKNGAYLGYTTKAYTVYANELYCSPTVSVPTVSAADALTARLTGDGTKLIRYVSTARVSVRAAAQYSYLSDVVVRNGDGNSYVFESYAFTEIDGECDLYKIGTNVFTITATDTRGFDTAIKYTFPAERFVEYVKLTCNVENEQPDTDGNIRLACSGNYFNASFGAVNNSLLVEYRYKENDGAFTEWATMTASTNGDTYSAYVNLSGLDYQSKYTFECRATDEAMTVTSADYVTKTTPVFDWGENDFAFNVPVDFRAGITVNGNESDIIVEHGTSGMWTWRKWNSGVAECWGRKTNTVYGSDWSAWGSLYQAEVLSYEAYPFTFTEVNAEIATLHSLSGGLLNCSAMGSSYNTTGSYFVVHPNELDDDWQFSISLYVRGRWK